MLAPGFVEHLGTGVQSTTVLLLACEGTIRPFDYALFADTGPMPLHGRNPDGTKGMARRQCTGEYKIKPEGRSTEAPRLPAPEASPGRRLRRASHRHQHRLMSPNRYSTVVSPRPNRGGGPEPQTPPPSALPLMAGLHPTSEAGSLITSRTGPFAADTPQAVHQGQRGRPCTVRNWAEHGVAHRRSARHRTEPDHGHSWWWPGGAARRMRSLTHAKVTIGDWKEEYNHDRPHSSLGYRTPRAYAAICTH